MLVVQLGPLSLARLSCPPLRPHLPQPLCRKCKNLMWCSKVRLRCSKCSKGHLVPMSLSTHGCSLSPSVAIAQQSGSCGLCQRQSCRKTQSALCHRFSRCHSTGLRRSLSFCCTLKSLAAEGVAAFGCRAAGDPSSLSVRSS